jgi:hypothetical protein
MFDTLPLLQGLDQLGVCLKGCMADLFERHVGQIWWKGFMEY